MKDLKRIADSLMKSTPQNLQVQTEELLRHVDRVIKFKEGDLLVEITRLKKKLRSIQKTRPKAKADGDPFYLRDKGCTAGLFPALYRVSAPDSEPVLCIYAKKLPDQPHYCGAHCVGFKVLSTGNVKICTGQEISIIGEK